MKTRIVYCLVSDGNDYYYEQLLISLCSLRIHNPDAQVLVVCDEGTNENVLKARKSFKEQNADTLVIDMPASWTNKEKSRYIKTHLRNLIKGDYLFIDIDTVICSPLDMVDELDCNIGAVFDSHVTRRIPSLPERGGEKWICGEAQKADMRIEGLLHFNSGVFYVKDTTVAYQLYDRWASIHDECKAKGVFCDQLPLMLANKELGEVITSIDPAMNCQPIWKEGVEILPDAKIVHYMPRQGHYILSSPWILEPIKQNDRIPVTVIWAITHPQCFFEHHSQIVLSNPI